jgi:hypothetical protein
MFVCCECCVLSSRAVHSSRGFLPTVVRRCVWSGNLKWGGTGPLGAVAPKTNNRLTLESLCNNLSMRVVLTTYGYEFYFILLCRVIMH